MTVGIKSVTKDNFDAFMKEAKTYIKDVIEKEYSVKDANIVIINIQRLPI